MYIHYFIILHGFIEVFSSTNTRSSLIFIINNVKSRHTTQNCHADILSRWLRHSFTVDKNFHDFSNDNNKISLNKKNRTANLMKMNFKTNKSIYRNSLMSTNVNRVVNTTEMDKNVNRTRIRRQFLRENTIDDDDEDDTNIYDDDDGRYFRNQQKEIAEQKRGLNDEHHRLIKMSTLS